jgi:predicted DNA-binding transcriptional regulator YafY
MPSSNFDKIRAAMDQRQQITCSYNGLHRELCPHTLGYKKGREKVLGYQFAGESSKGLPIGGEWRCMFIDQIADLAVRDGTWHTRDDHLRPQTCVDDVEFEVFA